jgi:hypothetical protein
MIHHQRSLLLHPLPHFHRHRNYPNLTINFHHHRFQNIQGMHQYHSVIDSITSSISSESRIEGVDHPHFLLVPHHVALPRILPLYKFPPGMRACLSHSSCDFIPWVALSDHPIVTKYFVWDGRRRETEMGKFDLDRFLINRKLGFRLDYERDNKAPNDISKRSRRKQFQLECVYSRSPDFQNAGADLELFRAARRISLVNPTVL